MSHENLEEEHIASVLHVGGPALRASEVQVSFADIQDQALFDVNPEDGGSGD